MYVEHKPSFMRPRKQQERKWSGGHSPKKDWAAVDWFRTSYLCSWMAGAALGAMEENKIKQQAQFHF
jgi:hypothetical protein